MNAGLSELSGPRRTSLTCFFHTSRLCSRAHELSASLLMRVGSRKTARLSESYNRGLGSSDHASERDHIALENCPLVSIVIPSRNSERTIFACLRAITFQSYRNLEVIVVDSLSTDSTVQIAKASGALVISESCGRSKGKNLGARVARGKYLYFVDSDCCPEPNTVADCVEISRHFDGVLTFNRDVLGKSRLSQLLAFRRRIHSYDPLSVALRFVSRSAFNSVGGFDIGLYAGEDLDFHVRFQERGFRIAQSAAVEWHLGSPTDLKGLLNRSLYYSRNYLAYASRNPLIAIQRLNPIREALIWKRSEESPSNFLPVMLISVISTMFLLVGVILSLRSGNSDCA